MEETNQSVQEKKVCSCCSSISGKNLLGVLLGLFLIILGAYFFVSMQNKIKEGAYIGQEGSFKNTITVSDRAEIYAKPDLAITSATVVTRAQTVGSAFKDNATRMNKIIEIAKAGEIEDKDLKTTNFNIYPQYEYPAPSYRRVFVGYEVRQSLQIKIRNLEKVGEIIENIANTDVNEMGDLQFIVDNPEILRSQAREEAIQKAKIKAKSLASQLGVKLIRISGFVENDGAYIQPYYREKIMDMGIGGESSVLPSIQTGESKIEVSVSLTYEIN